MTLYNKIYNLFHQWLNTEEEDEEEFKEWLNNRFININGKLFINETLISQSIVENNITVTYRIQQVANQRWISVVLIDSSNLILPTPNNENQEVTITVNDTIQKDGLINSNNITLWLVDGVPTASPSLTVIVTFKEYELYEGISYTFTVPSFSTNNALQTTSCNIEVI